MAGWGGSRPGAGKKKQNPANRPRLEAKPRLVRPEPKVTSPRPAEVATIDAGPAIDPQTWIEILPQVEAISKAYAKNKARTSQNSPFRLPKFPKAALPPENVTMAMDSALCDNLSFANQDWLAGEVINGVTGEGLLFLGYSYLSELAQRPEYRVMAETIADDATRKWIDFDVVGDAKTEREKRAKDPEGYDERMADPDERQKRLKAEGKLDKVKAMRDDQLRLCVKDRMYEQCRNDGFFGRSHLFLDIHTNGPTSEDELKMPIGDGRDSVSKSKVPKGSFKDLRTIEPVWTYPLNYNANDPLAESWYNPQVWYVMGKEIHGSRLQTFIGHPVPDMLKPAYAFGGLSLTQMAKPYVDIWLQTRQSVADLIHSFSVMVLMTDLSTLMQPGNVGALLARAAMFNMLRDNNGLFVANKNTEDFKNVSASLSGLHELQSQAQEHMASVHRIPLVKFTGIQPSGLNACLPGDTMILTERGRVPIRDVTLSDRVMTRQGFAPLIFSGVTKYATELIEIKTKHTTLRCTDNHPIWLSSTNEFVRAENVRSGDRLLLTGESGEAQSMGNPWHGEVSGGGRTGTDITSRGIPSLSERSTSIGGCGRPIEAQSLMDFISTTLTTISKTIRSIISTRCMEKFMPRITALNAPLAIGPGQAQRLSTASNAGDRSLLQNFQAERSFVAGRASLLTAELKRRRKPSLTRSALATCAERLLLRCAVMQNSAPEDAQPRVRTGPNTIGHTISRILKSTLAPQSRISSETPDVESWRVISVKRIPASEPVYDLSVAKGYLPEFFANGILTHNSSEGEIKVYDDTIMAYQSRFIAPNLTKIINFEQLSLFGEIDPAITYKFMPLREMTQAEKGQKEKDDADRNQKYVDMGALHPAEVRAVIINDPDLPYTELDPDDVPDLLSEEQQGLEPVGGRPQERQEGDSPRQEATKDDKGGGANDAADPFDPDA